MTFILLPFSTLQIRKVLIMRDRNELLESYSAGK